jgi:hypothetical protein
MLCSRFIVAVVVSGSVTGICSNIYSAALFNQVSSHPLFLNRKPLPILLQSADFSAMAVRAFADNNAADGMLFTLRARDTVQRAARNNAVQRFCEAGVLLVIVTAYSVVGYSSNRIIASALRTLLVASDKVVCTSTIRTLFRFKCNIYTRSARCPAQQAATAVSSSHKPANRAAHYRWPLSPFNQNPSPVPFTSLQRKVVFTFVFVFLAVLLRSSFYVLYAAVSAFQNTGDSCGLTCDPCRNVCVSYSPAKCLVLSCYIYLYDIFTYSPLTCALFVGWH